MVRKNRKIRKVLIIRFRRVGDAVLSSVLCNTLRLNFPDAEIHYVLNEAIVPLFENHPAVDKVIAFSERENHNLCRYVLKIWRLMRRERYDVILDLRGTLKTAWFSLFAPWVHYRIGRKKWYNWFWFRYRIKFSKQEIVSEIRENLHMLRPLKQEKELVYVRDFGLMVSREEVATFRMRMTQAGIDFAFPVVICTPLTRIAGKAWDKKRMQEIVCRLIERWNVQVVVNYASAEREEAWQFYEDMGRERRLFVNIEAKTLRELGAMCCNANFFFGNEGGARHIAQAFGLPCFAIYPPNVNKRKWLPHPSERNQGISPQDVVSSLEWEGLSDAERFERLSVDAVWEMLVPMLEDCLKG